MHGNYQTYFFSLSIRHSEHKRSHLKLVAFDQHNNEFHFDADVFLYLSISSKYLDADAPISTSSAFPFRIPNWIIKMYAVNREPTGFRRNMRIFQKKRKWKMIRMNWKIWRKRCVTIQNHFVIIWFLLVWKTRNEPNRVRFGCNERWKNTRRKKKNNE